MLHREHSKGGSMLFVLNGIIPYIVCIIAAVSIKRAYQKQQEREQIEQERLIPLSALLHLLYRVTKNGALATPINQSDERREWYLFHQRPFFIQYCAQSIGEGADPLLLSEEPPGRYEMLRVSRGLEFAAWTCFFRNGTLENVEFGNSFSYRHDVALSAIPAKERHAIRAFYQHVQDAIP